MPAVGRLRRMLCYVTGWRKGRQPAVNVLLRLFDSSALRRDRGYVEA